VLYSLTDGASFGSRWSHELTLRAPLRSLLRSRLRSRLRSPLRSALRRRIRPSRHRAPESRSSRAERHRRLEW
jgi:hypothetical protein